MPFAHLEDVCSASERGCCLAIATAALDLIQRLPPWQRLCQIERKFLAPLQCGTQFLHDTGQDPTIELLLRRCSERSLQTVAVGRCTGRRTLCVCKASTAQTIWTR